MNINASIIDQQLTGLLDKHSDWLPTGDANKKRSAAFVLLCMAKYLDISLENAVELLTEGGNDAGVDGLHIGEVEDNEFIVTIFQGKYKINDLDGTANFPENALQKAVNTLQVLFDPSRKVELNSKIAPKIEEIRSLILDAYIPNVRVILCNNGAQWTETANNWLDAAQQAYGDKVAFVHFNHDSIINILHKSKPIDATLALNGQAIVEDMNYMRVLIGRVAVQEIHKLFDEYGDRLLERNIRRYLGMHNNRVNSAIHETLCDPQQSDKFYFYNNGITIVCDKFNYNALQASDYKVQLRSMQIINGGQTCKTIQEAFNNRKLSPEMVGKAAYVMIRVYQLNDIHDGFVQAITHATNNQNPVELRDLRSNDKIQQQLESSIAGLGYTYKRKREEGISGADIITSSIVAEAVLAIWRRRPHQAKYLRKEHFGRLYGDIFKDLNGSQAVLAVLIFRFVEKERKRPSKPNLPSFMPYASHFLAMLIGMQLIQDYNISLADISHRNFMELVNMLQQHEADYHSQAVVKITAALKQCYGDRDISLQQQSATFRRGDLLEILAMPIERS